MNRIPIPIPSRTSLKETRNCVRCFKPALFWSGYVLDRRRQMVLAGWCSKKCQHIKGFCGHLTPRMRAIKPDLR